MLILQFNSTGMKENLQVNPQEETSEGKITVSKSALAQMPIALFDGNIRLIEKPEDIQHAVSALRSSDIIGFDTETRPNFKKGQNHTVALLQLSTRSTCYLFRINKLGLTDELKELLEDENLLKVGVSIHDDFHNLQKIREIAPKGFVELQQYVKQVGIADAALAKIYGIIFGKRISKSQRLSNWEADELTPAQQHYASLDAMACIEIYEAIRDGWKP